MKLRSSSNARLLCVLLLFASGAWAATAAEATYWQTLDTAGGPPQHAARYPIANALVVGDAVYLFDVGNGVLRQLDAAGLRVDQLHGVFLTHHHLDHNADLGVVLLSHWTFGNAVPIPLIGPPGTAVLANGLMTANAPTIPA